jgi:RNA polymerase sigma factor (sigma-70 family)
MAPAVLDRSTSRQGVSASTVAPGSRGPTKRLRHIDLRSAQRRRGEVPANLLTREEERRLIELAQVGDHTAEDALVRGHTRFVRSYALRWARNHAGVDADDLTQELLVTLVQVIHRFDLTKTTRLLTFAVWYFLRAAQRMTHQTAHVVTLAESVDASAIRSVSLNAPRGHGEKRHRDEVMALVPARGGSWDGLHGVLEPASLERLLCEALATLTSSQRDLVVRYFGLHNQPAQTFEQIGRHLGVSRQAVQLRLGKVLQRLQRDRRLAGMRAALLDHLRARLEG